jgi:CubicO group peptidase (beta-lactamase class C family)
MSRSRVFRAGFATLLLLVGTNVSAQTWNRARIQAVADSIVAEQLKNGRAAGMSVAVVRGRDTLVMKGYGLVDLEFDVPTPVNAIYEIGSVTKQFTATAILQLQEQGKLSLDDELTKYLPSYPTQGNRVTIRRLLDHTSGIKGYTELPEFRAMMMRKMPKDSLVALFSSKPFDFAPGDAQVYNNSAFFLLGLIIEKASGLKYEEYVNKNLFDKAGMADSRYCSENAIVKRRAHGYDASPAGLVRAAYLDHTWPYAAGSLCSTIGDLVAWNRALHQSNVLISPASHRELVTPGTTNDGARLRYGKGIGVDSAFGRAAYAHGGGINGFVSQLEYYPADSLSVVVLVNTAGPASPGAVARGIVETIYGKWASKAVAFTGSAADYAGEYRGVGRGQEVVIKIAVDASGKNLTGQAGQGPVAALLYLGNDTFERGGQRLTFVRENGKITKVRMSGGSAYAVLKKTQ